MPLTNGTNITVPSNISSTYSFTLHARDIDSRENQGLSTMAIVGIIAAVIIGVLCVAAIIGWAHKSNRAAFAASSGRRGQVRRGKGSSGHADLEKGTYGPSLKHAYSGNAGGMPVPSRSYDRSKTRFPVNTSRSTGGRSARPAHGQGQGPYGDDSPYSSTPSMEPRESERQARNQYSNGPAPSVHSTK